MADYRITGRARLDGAERSNVDRLRRACEAVEPLDLKIELDDADHLDRPIHFLASAGDEVIGYAGLSAGDDAEACGMVHPSWRSRGVGTALLAALRAATGDLGSTSFLVICEDAGPLAIEWMRCLGATLDSAERRMVVGLTSSSPPPATADAPLEVRSASDTDHDMVATILGEGFNDQPYERRLVGVADGTIVGTLRLIESPRRTMIYGFVIDERLRGRRLGSRMLATVLEELRADGVVDVGLEVNPDNTAAVRLYERYGFETVTTYRYMRLPVSHQLLSAGGLT